MNRQQKTLVERRNNVPHCWAIVQPTSFVGVMTEGQHSMVVWFRVVGLVNWWRLAVYSIDFLDACRQSGCYWRIPVHAVASGVQRLAGGRTNRDSENVDVNQGSRGTPRPGSGTGIASLT